MSEPTDQQITDAFLRLANVVDHPYSRIGPSPCCVHPPDRHLGYGSIPMDRLFATTPAAREAVPADGDAILETLDEDDLRYDHPVAMSGEPMDPVLFVRWGAIEPYARAVPAEDGLREAIEDAITLLEAAPAHNWSPGEPDETIANLRTVLASTERAAGEPCLECGFRSGHSAECQTQFSRAARSSGELDVAWAEAEAALPKGWFITSLRRRTPGSRFSVTAAVGYSDTGESMSGFGKTAPLALQALTQRFSEPPFAARLREPRQTEGGME